MSERDSEMDSVQSGRAEMRGPREAGPLQEKPGTRRRKSLSDKQLAILDFIQRAVATRGYPPSMREIGDAVQHRVWKFRNHAADQERRRSGS